ncbi:unnamed protein product [Peronospora belbahrii]|uniref:Uncharacterized protein n=1 Tax=Peronospora belbahrii TaxID=622444 RepID=A0AAU9KQ29_9STRA|nr:unnamed protein product [Peronospora belbahrii]
MGLYSMDCSQVEDEEAELHAAEQQIVRRFYICKSTSHLMAKCPARKAYLASKGRRPMRGRSKQGPAPKRSELSKTVRECKPGLLVVEGTIKGYDKPWIILIDSGASGNYVRRASVEGSQQYAEALVARECDTVTVRLATGTRVTRRQLDDEAEAAALARPKQRFSRHNYGFVLWNTNEEV